MPLPFKGAADVDRFLAPAAHSCSWPQVERLVQEALVRYDPEAAEAKRREAAERRRFDVHKDRVCFDGTVPIEGVVDLADALDLDVAVARKAKQLADLGDTDSLNVRRAKAVGELARQQLAFDYDTGEPTSQPGRSVVLFAHVSEE